MWHWLSCISFANEFGSISLFLLLIQVELAAHRRRITHGGYTWICASSFRTANSSNWARFFPPVHNPFCCLFITECAKTWRPECVANTAQRASNFRVRLRARTHLITKSIVAGIERHCEYCEFQLVVVVGK